MSGHSELHAKKMQQAYGIMKEENVDLWIIYGRETTMNNDPGLELLAPMNFGGESAILITKNDESIAIGGHFDATGYERTGVFSRAVMYPFGTTFQDTLFSLLDEIKPKTIALNYSESDVAADGLSHGNYLRLMKYFDAYGFDGDVISSEKLMNKVRGRKLPEEVALMEEACRVTQLIFDDAKDFIKAGVTEYEIFQFFQDRVRHYGVDFGWDADHCPGVQVGPNTVVGHNGPSQLKAEPGDLVTCDFGVAVGGYGSDMQRCYYVLKDDETEAPEDLQKVFKIVQDAIDIGVNAIKVGERASVPDDLCKKHIEAHGLMPNQASFGHQVGRAVHDGGVSLSRRMADDQLIEEGNVFTLDQGNRGDRGKMGQEDMGYVTKDGVRWLSPRQKEIYIVK